MIFRRSWLFTTWDIQLIGLRPNNSHTSVNGWVPQRDCVVVVRVEHSAPTAIRQSSWPGLILESLRCEKSY